MPTADTLELPMQEQMMLNEDLGVRQKLESAWSEGKFLCVGLDVSGESAEELWENAKTIVDATKDIACAFKPNDAFWAAKGWRGVQMLENICEYINTTAPNVTLLWDAKRGDIEKTNEGYEKAADNLGVDGITVHPYLGVTAVAPLLRDPSKLSFVLAHTSNKGAGEFQHLRLKSGEMLWEKVAHNIANAKEWEYGGVKGIVMGATYPDEVAKARSIVGDDVVMLIPGIGTQGGDLEGSVSGAMNSRANGFVINVSSGISGAKDPNTGKPTFDSIRAAAKTFDSAIRSARQDAIENPKPNYAERQLLEYNARLGKALLDVECLKFGNFILKSGKKSPIYVDIRGTITDPTLRGNISMLYVDMVKDLEAHRGEPFDIVAAIPEATTSYGAIVADRMERRLVQPRAATKAHGTKKSIEGTFNKGESVVLIDDLITDGGAKIGAIKQLELAGLHFGGLAMLIDREQGGFRELAKYGYPQVASTTLRAIVGALAKTGDITSSQKSKVMRYLEAA